MTIIHKIKQIVEVIWQVRVAKTQHPMLTPISRKEWRSKKAFDTPSHHRQEFQAYAN